MTASAGRLRRAARRAYRALPGKQPVFELLRRLAPLPERLYRHLHFEGVFEVRGPGGGFRMVHRGSQLENELFWRGLDGWEPEAVSVWRALAGEASCVLDVGAHSGLFGLVAARANPSATVVAFEPVPEVFRRLESNSRLNGGRMGCVQAAVSDAEGSAILYVPTGPSPLSASLRPEFLEGTEVVPETVRAVTLDAFAEVESLEPDLVKVDVEGHELAVLRGARRVLERSRPTLLVEVLDRNAAAGMESVLQGLGYVAFDLVPGSGPIRVEGAWAAGSAGNRLLLPEGRSCPPGGGRRTPDLR